tara:strand:+ start:907 stop:1059 length:153 start_codon:yes stop_codon:yes gene_type:complete
MGALAVWLYFLGERSLTAAIGACWADSQPQRFVKGNWQKQDATSCCIFAL